MNENSTKHLLENLAYALKFYFKTLQYSFLMSFVARTPRRAARGKLPQT